MNSRSSSARPVTRRAAGRIGRAVREGRRRAVDQPLEAGAGGERIGNESVGGAAASAGAVLSDYVAVQVDAIVAGHFAIHGDADDAVHQTRVACRRLRSTLRTFSACYDADAADRLGDELKWYAGVLGAASATSRCCGRGWRGVVGRAPVRSGRRAGRAAHRRSGWPPQLARRASRAARATDTASATPALLARLVEWRDNPPFTAAAGRPAATLDQGGARADRRAASAARAWRPAREGTDTEMHSARKAGKRARYASRGPSRRRAGGGRRAGQAAAGPARRVPGQRGRRRDHPTPRRPGPHRPARTPSPTACCSPSSVSTRPRPRRPRPAEQG